MPTDMDTQELADYFGVTRSKMAQALRNFGFVAGLDYSFVKKRRKWGVDWANVDWSKRNTELAKELRKTREYVSNMRKKWAPEEYRWGHTLRKSKK